ncbi:MAG: helix-turn-helix transcriptional regulator [Actinomycetota bacterium]
MPSPRLSLAARRAELGYSQETLAEAVGASPSAVARWEQGVTNPRPAFRSRLAEALQATLPELERLVSATGPAEIVGHAVPGWLDHYASLEQGAARLQTFDPITLPGLLQTAAYAEAVMRSNWVEVSGEVIAQRVAARMQRQAVLESRLPQPLELLAVIDESILHRPTGGRETMAAQLRYLLDRAALETVRLQVMPLSADAVHMASFGGFQLFSNEGATVPFMACTEDLTGINYLNRPQMIGPHTELFDHLSRMALSPNQSAELIATTAEKLS